MFCINADFVKRTMWSLLDGEYLIPNETICFDASTDKFHASFLKNRAKSTTL